MVILEYISALIKSKKVGKKANFNVNCLFLKFCVNPCRKYMGGMPRVLPTTCSLHYIPLLPPPPQYLYLFSVTQIE